MWNLNKKTIFALDGGGAILSALFTGLVLPFFSEQIGLPVQILYGLALFPLTYAVFSLTCFGWVRTFKPWMLLTVIAANIFYCLLSGILIFLLESLTLKGQALLTAEVVVILAVVWLEVKVYRSARE